jgi:DNA helicase II / ATP-dependent DNA helicase PcrA
MDDLLGDLNDAQRRAVLHSGGPLLVLAGPGSGKTRVIIRRIAWRILHDETPPHRILAITFTNRAADELKSRLTSTIGSASQVRVGTFHWMCAALLRRHASKLGYRSDFKLLKPREARQYLKAALDRLGEPELPHLSVVAPQISRLKNRATTGRADTLHPSARGRLQEYLHAYQEELRRANSLDLDDLLFLAARLLEEDSKTREGCRAAYEEVLVDEYQDVNPVQHRLLELLLPLSRSFTAVGDEDQAIYGWRAADIEGILRFPATFPDAETVKLEESYRGTKHILRAARSLVTHNEHRIDKNLRTANTAGQRPLCFVAANEREEGDWIAEQVATAAKQHDRPWNHFSVLYRTNVQSRVVEDAFLRRRIPYHIHAGRGFYERPEVRRALALLKLVLEPLDHGAARFLIGQQLGIGPKRAALLEERARQAVVPLIVVLRDSHLQDGLHDQIRSDFEKLAGQVDELIAGRALALSRLVSIAAMAALPDQNETPQVDYESARDNLSELETVAQEFQHRKSTLRSFLESLQATGTSDEVTEGVSCMSIHAAKGLEFPIVFVAGLEEGTLPHRRALEVDEVEEERRLCYVAMTRASEQLFLSYSRSRVLAGRTVSNRPSRFLGEIGGANLVIRLSSQLRQTRKGVTVSYRRTPLKEDVLAG